MNRRKEGKKKGKKRKGIAKIAKEKKKRSFQARANVLAHAKKGGEKESHNVHKDTQNSFPFFLGPAFLSLGTNCSFAKLALPPPKLA